MNVLALDYRGYGQSQGEPSEAGLYLDAEAAYAWLVQRVPPHSIVLFGESLGGGLATYLAVEREVGALVLLSTFTSVPDMARRLFPFLPVQLVVRTRFNNLERIARVAVPKLVIHSRLDESVPVRMAERLYAAARPPKVALWLQRAGHNGAFTRDGEALLAGLRRFLSDLDA